MVSSGCAVLFFPLKVICKITILFTVNIICKMAIQFTYLPSMTKFHLSYLVFYSKDIKASHKLASNTLWQTP